MYLKDKEEIISIRISAELSDKINYSYLNVKKCLPFLSKSEFIRSIIISFLSKADTEKIDL